MRRLVPKHVRTRLAILHALAMSLALGAFSVLLYFQYRSNLYADLDLKLRGHLEATDDAIQDLLDGRPTEAAVDPEDWLTEVWTKAGARVYTSGIAAEMPLGPLGPDCARSYEARNETAASGLRVRDFCQESSTHPGAYVIRVARARERVEDQLGAFRTMELLGMPLIVLLSGLLGYLLAHRALRPVARLTAAAQNITASRLSDRLPVHNPDDELGRLAAAFNGTFQNLERSFHHMRRFTSDASHELRTPLTAIRALGEVALRTKGGGQDPYETIGSMLEETQQLQNLCESLLMLSRGDAGQIEAARAPTDLRHLVDDVVDLLQILAEEKRQCIDVQVPEMPASVDGQLLKRAFGNLLDNAIKYSPVGSTIRVTGSVTETTVRLAVLDRGPGIAPKHQPHIFERFYRVDAARGRGTLQTGGVGLGLSIAKWAVELHGGRIHVESKENEGSTFTIELPRSRS